MVYPFKGEGERRTVASNLNCWEVEGSMSKMTVAEVNAKIEKP